MKMRPGTQTGFLLCGKEWDEGEALEVRSPWDQGLIGKVHHVYATWHRNSLGKTWQAPSWRVFRKPDFRHIWSRKN